MFIRKNYLNLVSSVERNYMEKGKCANVFDLNIFSPEVFLQLLDIKVFSVVKRCRFVKSCRSR